MARNRNYPPTTIYQIHDYETDTRDLEKAKADEHAEKLHAPEGQLKDKPYLTPAEAEMLRELKRKKGR